MVMVVIQSQSSNSDGTVTKTVIKDGKDGRDGRDGRDGKDGNVDAKTNQ